MLAAISHLCVFLYLNNKQAEGEGRAAPQNYVSTASNILSNAFGFSLMVSLAIAFTQNLWYILRNSTLKVSTIESFFTLRTNPFRLFDRSVFTQPLLVFIAIFIWSIQIAASFPPGALTITNGNKMWNQTIDVLTFNPSFVNLLFLTIYYL